MPPSLKSAQSQRGAVTEAREAPSTRAVSALPVATSESQRSAPLSPHEREASNASCKRLHGKHWLEAEDPRHRYGKLLMPYYELWSGQQPHSSPHGLAEGASPAARGVGSGSGGFFEWLDWGPGRAVEIAGVTRAHLDESQVKYLTVKEREAYRIVIQNGRLHRYLSGALFDTVDGMNKSIFVMSPSGELYAGLKEVGRFHHSSFLCGGAVKFAGTWSVRQGVLLEIGPHSGHYRPTAADLLGFLESLDAAGLDLAQARLSVKETCVKKEVVVGGLSFAGVHGSTAAALLARWHNNDHERLHSPQLQRGAAPASPRSDRVRRGQRKEANGGSPSPVEVGKMS